MCESVSRNSESRAKSREPISESQCVFCFFFFFFCVFKLHLIEETKILNFLLCVKFRASNFFVCLKVA